MTNYQREMTNYQTNLIRIQFNKIFSKITFVIFMNFE